jgi:hypothetical protein
MLKGAAGNQQDRTASPLVIHHPTSFICVPRANPAKRGGPSESPGAQPQRIPPRKQLEDLCPPGAGAALLHDPVVYGLPPPLFQKNAGPQEAMGASATGGNLHKPGECPPIRRTYWVPLVHERILSRLKSFSFSVSFFRHGGQRFTGQSFLDEAGQEIRKGNNILADARFFESLHVNLAVSDRYDGPRISTGRHHEIHQEAPHPAVPVHIRMDVHEHEVTEHDPHRRFLFLAQ